MTVTCEQPDGTTTKLLAQRGANLRQLLTDNGLNVYQNIARITNCEGTQVSGTCVVDTGEGSELMLNLNSLDEVSTLRQPGSKHAQLRHVRVRRLARQDFPEHWSRHDKYVDTVVRSSLCVKTNAWPKA